MNTLREVVYFENAVYNLFLFKKRLIIYIQKNIDKIKYDVITFFCSVRWEVRGVIFSIIPTSHFSHYTSNNTKEREEF